MTLVRRMAAIEQSLTPTQRVLAWLDEAHPFGTLSAYVDSRLDQPADAFPINRLARDAAIATRTALRNKPPEVANPAVRKTLRETIFRFELVMRINVTAHETIDREGLLYLVFAGQFAMHATEDRRERRGDNDYLRRLATCRDLCFDRVDDMLAEEEARSTVQARYLDGHEAVFPSTLAEWAKRLRECQELAVMADRLCELDGAAPFVPPDPDATAQRVAVHLADLVESRWASRSRARSSARRRARRRVRSGKGGRGCGWQWAAEYDPEVQEGAMAAEGAVSATSGASAELPYARSWIDLLTRAVDRAPIPAWACYGLLLLGVGLLINAINWTAGRYPPGTFDPAESGYAVYSVYMLALMHYLNGVAGSKIQAFRPALDIDAVEYQRLRYELTTLPARQASLAGLGGLAFVAFLYTTEGSDAGIGRLPLAVLTGSFLIEGFTFALLAVLIYHTIRQLRLVSRIHALASRIDLFEPAPLHAFSELTARTGIGLLVLTAYSYVIDPSITSFGVGLTGLIVIVAAAAFVLPLEGMHRRIVVEKERLQLEANWRLKAMFAELHQSVDERDLSVSDGLNKTLESLQLERDALSRMATWPWQPATLRGFVSALFAPIVLWFIIRILERFV